jgi:hypothetical protein
MHKEVDNESGSSADGHGPDDNGHARHQIVGVGVGGRVGRFISVGLT